MYFYPKIYILHSEKSGVLEGLSMFLGLHMNITPLPERGTSLGISMRFNLPSDLNSIIIEGAYEKLLIRLGNLII